MMKTTTTKAGLQAALICILASGPASAAAVVWDAGTNNDWSGTGDTTSWSGGTYNDGDDAQFNGAGTGVVNITGTVNPGSISVDTSSGDYTFTESGGSITGSGALTKSGTGTLTIETDMSAYTGTATINGGTLQLSDDADPSFSVYNGNININNAAELKVDATGGLIFIQNNVITFDSSGGGAIVLAGGNTVIQNSTLTTSGGAQNTISGPALWNTGGGTNTFNVADGTAPDADLLVTARMYNSGNLTKTGAGTMELTGDNFYNGNTTVSGGTLEIGGAGRLGSGTYAAAVSIASGASFEHSSSADQALSGLISGDGEVIMSGTGTLTLNHSSSNTYTGGTTIKSGTVINSGNGTNGVNGLGTGDILLGDTTGSADATLQMGLSTSTTYSNNLAVQSGNTGTMSLLEHGNGNFLGTLTLGSAGVAGKGVTLAEIGHPLWSSNFTGVIQDNATLVGAAGDVTIGSNNLGTIGFNAANTYTGDTIVNGGKLSLNNVNALQNSTLNTGSSGAQQVAFNVGGANTYNIGGLKGADDLAIGSNTISVGSNDANTTYTGDVNGTGDLTKVGSGTLTLSGANSYTGATNVDDGTLLVNGSTAAGAVTVSGGTLAGTGTVGGATTLSGTGKLSAGIAGIGTLTFSQTVDVSSAGANSMLFDLGAGTLGVGTGDLVDVTGSFTYSGLELDNFSFANAGYSSSDRGEYTWTLFDTGGLSGSLGLNLTDITGFEGIKSVSLFESGNQIQLTMFVPEPSSTALLGLGLSSLLLRRKRS